MTVWHHWLDGHEFECTPGVGDGQGGLACCNSWGLKELDTTERLNWTELKHCSKYLKPFIQFLIFTPPPRGRYYYYPLKVSKGFTGGWLSGKESTCQCRRCRRHELNPWVRKIPWKRTWQPTSVLLPGKSHGQKSLVGDRVHGVARVRWISD